MVLMKTKKKKTKNTKKKKQRAKPKTQKPKSVIHAALQRKRSKQKFNDQVKILIKCRKRKNRYEVNYAFILFSLSQIPKRYR